MLVFFLSFQYVRVRKRVFFFRRFRPAVGGGRFFFLLIFMCVVRNVKNAVNLAIRCRPDIFFFYNRRIMEEKKKNSETLHTLILTENTDGGLPDSNRRDNRMK